MKKIITSEKDNYFMQRAIDLAMMGMDSGAGGPFGAVIAKNDKVIAEGFNRVTSSNDPTAHAEIVAIREATKKLKSFQLIDCTIYTSCEPCPMCLGAIYWARPKAVYFACDKKDAAGIQFDDQFIYDELANNLEDRSIEFVQIMRSQALNVFNRWLKKTDKVHY